LESSETVRQAPASDPRGGMKIQSELHGDMQRPTEMIGPLFARAGVTGLKNVRVIARGGSDPVLNTGSNR